MIQNKEKNIPQCIIEKITQGKHKTNHTLQFVQIKLNKTMQHESMALEK